MTTQPGDTQYGEENRQRGGFREAVNELFGRGERREDERDDERTGHETGYADDAATDPATHETGAQSEYHADQPAAGAQSEYQGGGADQQTTFGQEVRGDAIERGHLQQGGDPTAQGAVQHGGEYRGDPDLPGQAQYGDGLGSHEATGSTYDAPRGDVQDDVRGGGHDGVLGDASGGTHSVDAGGVHGSEVASSEVPDSGVHGGGVSGGDVRDDLRADRDDTAGFGDRRADDDLTERVDDRADGTATSSTGGHGFTGNAGEFRPVSDDPVQADHGAQPRVDTADQGVGVGHSDSGVGMATAGDTTAASAAGSGATTDAGPASTPGNLPDADSGENAALVTRDRAKSYSSRWDAVKGDFVDDPRHAVRNADTLVGELLDELQGLFKSQRSEIERGLDNDETSTEDLRIALRRYRSFFDRLLSI